RHRWRLRDVETEKINRNKKYRADAKADESEIQIKLMAFCFVASKVTKIVRSTSAGGKHLSRYSLVICRKSFY
ncbi:hypothetical protein ACFL2H_03580, partial [Planctomycetota bacterium]